MCVHIVIENHDIKFGTEPHIAVWLNCKQQQEASHDHMTRSSASFLTKHQTERPRDAVSLFRHSSFVFVSWHAVVWHHLAEN